VLLLGLQQRCAEVFELVSERFELSDVLFAHHAYGAPTDVPEEARAAKRPG
jgi:hypothetical protein